MASFIHFALLAIAIIFLQHTPILATQKSYIVYLGTHSHGLNPTELDTEVATQSHYDLLGSVLGSSEKARESVQYHYNKYINGFAAKLTEDEADRIRTSSNVVSVFENRILELHTTRSWEFLGLEQNGNTPSNSLWNSSNYGDGVIIGTFDTGVWPESESFNDQGFGPIPSRWKGACTTGSDPTFKCNNKLIGARYFHGRYENQSALSPRDTEGHGSHTLSTAGGSFVKGASVFNFGSGIAKGGSPKARVASYKVCWPKTLTEQGGCSTSDILAAFEVAIGDGVDVLSLSIGGSSIDFKQDGIAIGSFHAVQHGITVVTSAGNSGPGASTVSNIAPWLLTIGASTMDRAFSNRVYLGNSTRHFKGANIGPNRMRPKRQFHPLIDGASAYAVSSSPEAARFCLDGSLDPSKVQGKIIVCLRGKSGRTAKGLVVQKAGGVGMIFRNDEENGDDIMADPHFLPASHVSYKDGLAILDYINKTTNPTALINNAKTVLDIKPAPVMASFSSRGPSELYPQILKPDITAPGVSVIAAFTGAVGASGLDDDTRKIKYNVMSGTSMSCPHVAGIVGLLKSLHPDWSPAAIRSALMTTATTFDNRNKTILDSDKQDATPFGYGAGHVNPNAAADPGLIYNLTQNDFLNFLCSIAYTENDLKIFTSVSYKCENSTSILNFNYPSITITNFTTSATVTRTVTNVGNPGTYEVKVTAPAGVDVSIVPSKLTFNQTNEEQTFKVELKANGAKPAEPGYVFGSLVWSDGTHNVRSPITVERV